MYLVAKALLSRGCVYIVAENLAFTMKDNTLDRVVLLDFGTVRATRDPFTSMGMTPQYMAPESCQGAFYDFKSEIWVQMLKDLIHQFNLLCGINLSTKSRL